MVKSSAFIEFPIFPHPVEGACRKGSRNVWCATHNSWHSNVERIQMTIMISLAAGWSFWEVWGTRRAREEKTTHLQAVIVHHIGSPFSSTELDATLSRMGGKTPDFVWPEARSGEAFGEGLLNIYIYFNHNILPRGVVVLVTVEGFYRRMQFNWLSSSPLHPQHTTTSLPTNCK